MANCTGNRVCTSCDIVVLGYVVFYVHSVSWFIVAVAIFEENDFSYSGALFMLYFWYLCYLLQGQLFSYKVTLDNMQKIGIII